MRTRNGPQRYETRDSDLWCPSILYREGRLASLKRIEETASPFYSIFGEEGLTVRRRRRKKLRLMARVVNADVGEAERTLVDGLHGDTKPDWSWSTSIARQSLLPV